VPGPYYVAWARADGTTWITSSADGVVQLQALAAPPRPNAIVVAGDAVYTADGAHVYRTAVTPGAARTTVGDASKPVVALAVGHYEIAWATTDEIWAAPQKGGAATRLASDAPGISSIRVDMQRIYWSNASTGTVLACARTGCVGPPETIAFGQRRPRQLQRSYDELLWLDDDAVRARQVPP
jgi:hypothetical protein